MTFTALAAPVVGRAQLRCCRCRVVCDAPSPACPLAHRPCPEALQRVGRLYEGLAAASLKLASSYSTKELELIRDYLEGSLQILRDQTGKFT